MAEFPITITAKALEQFKKRLDDELQQALRGLEISNLWKPTRFSGRIF